VTGRQGRRCKQLLDDLKETRRYWKMKRKHYIPVSGELTFKEAMGVL